MWVWFWLSGCPRAPVALGPAPPASTWVPAGTTTVTRSPGNGDVQLASFVVLIPAPCVRALVERVETYRVSVGDQPPVLVLFGDPTLAEIEACVSQVGAPLGLTFAKHGKTIVLTGADGSSTYARSGDGRLIWGGSREQLDAFESGPPLAAEDPLQTFLGQLDDRYGLVSTLDLTSGVSGVRSSGWVGLVDRTGPTPTMDARVSFRSSEDAAQFVTFVTGVAASSEDPVAHDLAVLLSPEQEGADVRFDYLALTTALERADVQAWVRTHAAP